MDGARMHPNAGPMWGHTVGDTGRAPIVCATLSHLPCASLLCQVSASPHVSSPASFCSRFLLCFWHILLSWTA